MKYRTLTFPKALRSCSFRAMKRAMKKKSNLYAFLDHTKVLETGSEKAIQAAKAAYWKAYKTQWRKAQRKRTKQYVIALLEPEAERIVSAARTHHRSPTRFIKDACFAYLSKQYLPVDPLGLATIRQLLEITPLHPF